MIFTDEGSKSSITSFDFAGRPRLTKFCILLFVFVVLKIIEKIFNLTFVIFLYIINVTKKYVFTYLSLITKTSFMSSNHHTDAIFVEKRKPKNPIKFQVQLNEEQKETKNTILNNDITVITGQAGSGKTLVAVQTALDQLFNKEVEKIIVARPVVTAKEDIGFLPGGIKEKLDPFVAPIYDNAYRVYDKEKVDMYFERGQIEIVPFAFMRGRNFSNAFIIVDEAQNVTDSQMEMVISRLCKGSKMVIVGDTSQIDLKTKKDSGMFFLAKQVATTVPGVAAVNLKTNHRHPIVESVLNMYKELRDL